MANQPKTGTVVLKDGIYCLEAEGKLRAIPVSPKTQPAQLKDVVGQKVEILYSEPTSFVAGLLVGGAYPSCATSPETLTLASSTRGRVPPSRSNSLTRES